MFQHRKVLGFQPTTLSRHSPSLKPRRITPYTFTFHTITASQYKTPFMNHHLIPVIPNKMLCLNTGKCQRSCDNNSIDTGVMGALGVQECAQGAVWCAAAGRCVVDGVCGRSGNSSATLCPPGEVTSSTLLLLSSRSSSVSLLSPSTKDF